MATKIVPTFLLKRVNLDKLTAAYQNGYYRRETWTKSPIKISQTTVVLAPVYGSSNKDPIFCIKDKNNSGTIVATTGHSNYQVFTKSGGSLPTHGRCDYCKQDFDDSLAVGYPIAYQEKVILNEQSIYRLFYSFWTEGTFCCFECALACVRQGLNRTADFRDSTIRESERFLRLLHRLTYPQAEQLLPAPDYHLLLENGGSLTRSEWLSKKHSFIRTDRVLLIPAKVEYDRRDNQIKPH